MVFNIQHFMIQNDSNICNHSSQCLDTNKLNYLCVCIKNVIIWGCILTQNYNEKTFFYIFRNLKHILDNKHLIIIIYISLMSYGIEI